MLEAIHTIKSHGTLEARDAKVANGSDGMKLKKATQVVRNTYADVLASARFPCEYW